MTDSRENVTMLYFGSFDPVHVGHLIVSSYMLNTHQVSEVWFVISPSNPFKTNQYQTPEPIRQKMLELAIANVPGMTICDVEFSMPSPHYTHATISKLIEMYPMKKFALLMGADNIGEFEKWRNYQQIIKMTEIYIYPRPGYHVADEWLRHEGIRLVNAPVIGISSTMIRKNLASGFETRFFLPLAVYDYIIENKVY